MPRRVYSLTKAGRRALDAWLEEADETYEVRDEGLLKLFFGDLMSAEQRLDLVRRRQAWYEESAALFRRIGDELGELDESSGAVLRYGIELMEWNAAWWRRPRAPAQLTSSS